MGYAADMQSTVEWFANILNNTDGEVSVCVIKDEIAYKMEYRGLRSTLDEIGAPIHASTKYHVCIEDTEAHVHERFTKQHLLTIDIDNMLPYMQDNGLDVDDIDDWVVLAYMYDELPAELSEALDRLYE